MQPKRIPDIGLKRSSRVLRDRVEAIGFNLARCRHAGFGWTIYDDQWRFVMDRRTRQDVEAFLDAAEADLRKTDLAEADRAAAYHRWAISPGRRVFG